jgi:hypothetical protein
MDGCDKRLSLAWQDWPSEKIYTLTDITGMEHYL